MEWDDWGHELDFARGYIFIFPKEIYDDMLFISDKCPSDVREKIEELWIKIKKEQERRYLENIFSPLDYFYPSYLEENKNG